jgi:hypothetical protein
MRLIRRRSLERPLGQPPECRAPRRILQRSPAAPDVPRLRVYCAPDEPGLRYPSRVVRGACAARRRRHGRGVSRSRREAQSRRRDQGPAGDRRARSGSSGAVRAGGAGPRGAQPREHRARLRRRRPAARAGDGAGRGRGPGAGRRARAAAGGAGRRDRPADRRRAGGRARGGHHPPGSQAGQREGARGRDGQGPGLRPGESHGGAGIRRAALPRAVPHLYQPGRDAAGRAARHRRLHGAGAGAREGRGQARGHLGVRVRAVRDAHRTDGLRRRDAHRHARGDHDADAGSGGAAGRYVAGPPAAARALPRARSDAPAARHRRGAPRARGPGA